MQQGLYWWVVVLDLGWWWVDEKERKTERRRIEREREREREREIFYIISLCNLYYFNVLYVKINNRILSVL